MVQKKRKNIIPETLRINLIDIDKIKIMQCVICFVFFKFNNKKKGVYLLTITYCKFKDYVLLF
jgi:hypothetical protein